MLVYWMIWYCYCCLVILSGFKCMFMLHSPVFSISWYGHRYHGTWCFVQQHPITVYKTGYGVCVVLVLSAIRCSCYYLLDRMLFHHDFSSWKLWLSFGILWPLITFELHFSVVLDLQMHNSLDVSAPGHPPWILDWTCYLWTPLCHVYIPY